jgi:hypothetical protein
VKKLWNDTVCMRDFVCGVRVSRACVRINATPFNTRTNLTIDLSIWQLPEYSVKIFLNLLRT